MNHLDHIVLAAADLSVAKEDFAAASGVLPADGGAHMGLGTRNALASFGTQSYLEIIAPDPEQPQTGTLGEHLSTLNEPTLWHWAIRVDDLSAVASHAEQLGLTPTPIRDTQRQQPDGTILKWRLMGIGGHSLGGLMPFYIDWLDCPHPALHTPQAGSLTKMVLRAPEGAIHSLLADVEGIELAAGAPSMRVNIDSLAGPIEYQTDQPAGFRFG